MNTELISHIRKYVQLNEVEIDLINDCFHSLLLQDKDYLLQAGQQCKYHYFVAKGCLSMYFYTEKGTSQIVNFAIENWWITDYFSFINATPSDYNIQAIEKSEIFRIERSTYNKLLEKIPILNSYFQIMMQRALAASQLRMKLNYSLSKEDMYLHFKSSFPDFVQRVPQYMLASFLGFTPEYLSELRKKSTK